MIKTVRINFPSLTGQALLYTLPCEDINIIDEQNQVKVPDVCLLDLDCLAEKQLSIDCDYQVSMVGLTFQNPETAILDSRLVSFDCSNIRIIQKPFFLSYVREVIINAPQGFQKVYGQEKINIFLQLKKFLAHGGSEKHKKVLKNAIKLSFPDLLAQSNSDFNKCYMEIPYHIIDSLYAGVKHAGGNTGLEGQLGQLAGAANCYSSDDENRRRDYLYNVETFLKETKRQRKALEDHARDMKNLNEIIGDLQGNFLNIDLVLERIISLHEELLMLFNRLEARLQENLKGQVNPDDVSVLAIKAGKKLKELTGLLENRLTVNGGSDSIGHNLRGTAGENKTKLETDREVSEFEKSAVENNLELDAMHNSGEEKKIKILLIDDKPNMRLKKIEDSINRLSHNIQIDSINNNSESSVRKAIEDCDLIILDWHFPEDRPDGKETLWFIRKIGFTGPILIYTVGFGQFDKYIGKGQADDYFWEAWGTDTLTNAISRLISSLRSSEQKKLKTATIEDELKYYSSIEEMNNHFYHPYSTANLSESQKDIFREKVILATCEWSEKDQKSGSGVMGEIIRNIEKLASTDIPVLILGDTGTGKELIAKLIHFHHKNKDHRYDFDNNSKNDYYMALNCGAFPEAGTLNVELFGSLPGAYTDAIEKAGVFEQVTVYNKQGNAEKGGTVFLDEVGLMQPSSQAFLLRVLQECYVHRMGHNEQKAWKNGKIEIKPGIKIESRLFGKIPVKFRLVAATNEDLLENTKKGDFRKDLFYRIATAIIKLPPLRYRSRKDFNLLFQYFLHRFAKKHKRIVKLKHNGNGILEHPSSDLIQYLSATFSWRGNVRELEGLVNTMVAYSDPDRDHEDYLGRKDIPEFHWVKQGVYE